MPRKKWAKHKCCWCGCRLKDPARTEQRDHRLRTKEHLVPQSLTKFANIGLSERLFELCLMGYSCRQCNQARGNKLGPQPTATEEGWATLLWNEGMAPWITLVITRPQLFARRV